MIKKIAIVLTIILLPLIAGCQGSTISPTIPPTSINITPEQESTAAPVHEPTLIELSWSALNQGRYEDALDYAQQTIELFQAEATQQQALIATAPPIGIVSSEEKEYILTSWALNDVGTAYFISGQAMMGLGNQEGAIEAYTEALAYPYARTWDPSSESFWSPAAQAQDRLTQLTSPPPSPDWLTSAEIISRAWNALNQGQYDDALDYTQQCIAMYEEQATQQQSSVQESLPVGSVDENVKDIILANWALNDVGTAYFIQVQIYITTGNMDQAQTAYTNVIRFPEARTWNPTLEIFWSPEEAAREAMLEAVSMPNPTPTPLTSESLIVEAWRALDMGQYERAIENAQRCIDLFLNEAILQQNNLTEAPPLGRVSEYQQTAIFANWALNDVGTAYYILGRAYAGLGRYSEASNAYYSAMTFDYARTWDPVWESFWSPADEANRERSELPEE